MWLVLVILAVLAVLAVALVAVARWLDAPDHGHFDHPEPPLVKPAHEISDAHEDVVQRLAEFHRTSPSRSDIAAQRAHMEDLFFREVDAEIEAVDVAGVPGEWVRAADARPERRLLYLHGGAFRLGSPRTHRGLTSEISRRTGASVLAIDYRLTPEHPLSACHEDARSAWRWVLEYGPHGAGPAEAAYVVGDSAGGNLTLALIQWARDAGLRAPDAAVALAPSTDSTLSSPSWRRNADSDPFLGPSIGPLLRIPRSVLLPMSWALSRTRANHPRFSPLLGDLSGLPPTLIQVSADEMLYDDARRYANKAAAAGSPVEIQVWPKLVHVFQGFAPDLPEANDALDRIGEFIRKHTPEGTWRAK